MTDNRAAKKFKGKEAESYYDDMYDECPEEGTYDYLGDPCFDDGECAGDDITPMKTSESIWTRESEMYAKYGLGENPSIVSPSKEDRNRAVARVLAAQKSSAAVPLSNAIVKLDKPAAPAPISSVGGPGGANGGIGAGKKPLEYPRQWETPSKDCSSSAAYSVTANYMIMDEFKKLKETMSELTTHLVMAESNIMDLRKKVDDITAVLMELAGNTLCRLDSDMAFIKTNITRILARMEGADPAHGDGREA